MQQDHRMVVDHRVVVITGASSGIGEGLARWYAQKGNSLGLLARRGDRLEKLATELAPLAKKIAFRVADVRDRTGTIQAIRELESELGPTDLLYANSGVGHTNTLHDLNAEGAVEVIQTNLLGAMAAIEAVYPTMLQRNSGHIVGISSLASYKGLPGAAAYCASKAGLTAYLESLRITLYKTGIKVTTVCPGFITTPMTAKQKNMMLVMDVERAVRRITRAVDQKKKVFNFPRRMRFLLWCAKWAPDRWMYKLGQE